MKLNSTTAIGMKCEKFRYLKAFEKLWEHLKKLEKRGGGCLKGVNTYLIQANHMFSK